MSTTLVAELATLPVVLMERITGGILVELVWNGRSGVTCGLTVRVTEPGSDARSGRVPASKGLDAFDHPYTYLRELPA